jgi:sugar phosphate isomerase/epimerase
VTPPALSLADLSLGPALRLAAERGFTHVVPDACAERPEEDFEALADSGLVVAGARLGGGLPDGCSLDATDLARRRTALDLLKRQAADAARLGATFVLLPPGNDGSPVGRACFTEAAALLAGYAAGRMLRLCLGHAAGSALPTARQALALLDAIPAGALMLDAAECHRGGEDPVALLRHSGDRVGCVVLSGAHTEALADRLRAAPYDGALVVRDFPHA